VSEREGWQGRAEMEERRGELDFKASVEMKQL